MESERNIIVNIYDLVGDVLYTETVPFRKFMFMKVFNNALKNGVDKDDIDIQQTIKQLNKEPDLVIKSVMVVEDEELLREGYIDSLTRLCHYVETFDTTDSAYYAFKEDPSKYDVVMTDNILPNSTYSGSQLAKELKRMSSKVKVHIVTGEISTVDRDIFDHDVENTLSKPINEYTFAMTLGKGKLRKRA